MRCDRRRRAIVVALICACAGCGPAPDSTDARRLMSENRKAVAKLDQAIAASRQPAGFNPLTGAPRAGCHGAPPALSDSGGG